MNLIKPSFSTGYAKNASESANPNLWKGLVGAWMPSFGVTGNTLKDVSGNGNDGTLTNMDAATDWVATSKGLALDFDGVDDYVTIKGSNSLNVSTGAFSWSAWVFPTSLSNYEMIFSQKAYYAYLSFYNSTIAFDSEPTVFRGGFVTQNRWHHVVGTRGNGIMQIFLNGVEVASRADTQEEINSTEFAIGRYETGSSHYFHGKIAQVLFHNRALSPSEIKQLYLNPAAPFQKKTTTVVSVSVAPPTTTAKAVVLKKPKPSYATGYARNASESANPNLWKGLVGAFVPSFGFTGEALHDLTASKNDGIIYHQNRGIDEVWTKTKVGSAVSTYPSGGFQGITTPANNLSMDEFTIVANVRFENRYSGTYPCITVKENNYLDRNWFLGMFPDEQIAFVRSISGDRWVKSGVVPNKTDFYSIAATSSKVLSHAIYVNGQLKNSAHYTGTRSVAGNQNYIGIYKGNVNYPTGGSISSILYYSRILSPTEIKQLYLNPAAPFERKQQTVGLSTAQAFNPYWGNQSTQLAGTLQ